MLNGKDYTKQQRFLCSQTILSTTRLNTTVLQIQTLRYLDSTIKSKDFPVFKNILHSGFASWVFIEYLKPLTYLGCQSVEKVITAGLNVALPWQAMNMWQSWLCLNEKRSKCSEELSCNVVFLRPECQVKSIFILIWEMVNKEKPIKQEEFLLPTVYLQFESLPSKHNIPS